MTDQPSTAAPHADNIVPEHPDNERNGQPDNAGGGRGA